MKSWIADELKACSFPDARLAKRFETLVERLSERMGQSIPLACQDWANTKAAYRFFANKRVNETQILHGHFQATQSRFSDTDGPILVVHDTTEFSYKREEPCAIGITTTTYSNLGRNSRPRLHTVCGLLLHSSLAVTTDGVPLGLSAVRFWSRKKFKGTNRLKKKVNPTRVPVERKESIRWIESLKQSTELLGAPDRCVHVGDRESDMYEFFCAAKGMQTHFLVRTSQDRLAENGTVRVSEEMKEVRVKGLHRIEVQDDKGKPSKAILVCRFSEFGSRNRHQKRSFPRWSRAKRLQRSKQILGRQREEIGVLGEKKYYGSFGRIWKERKVEPARCAQTAAWR